MKIPRISIIRATDPRTPAMLASYSAIEQARADIAIEATWRRRVAENVRRRLAAKTANNHKEA